MSGTDTQETPSELVTVIIGGVFAVILYFVLRRGAKNHGDSFRTPSQQAPKDWWPRQ